MQIRCDYARYSARTASTVARRHCDILLTRCRKRQRKPLHGCGQPGLPQNAAGACIESAEHAIQIAHERNTTCRRDHPRQEWCSLFVFPNLAHAADIIGCKLAYPAVCPWHLKETTLSAVPTSSARDLFDCLANSKTSQASSCRLLSKDKLPPTPRCAARQYRCDSAALPS